MSTGYISVQWNRQKRVYDGVLAAGLAGSLGTFVAVTFLVHPSATFETALIRGLGVTAFTLLHVILAIGPLARLDARFLPLVYNRRHLGVALGVLALAHATFALIQYHALGNADPLASLLGANRDWTSLRDFPFEWFGVVALVILSLMAATSHDFWLSVLTPPVWKQLHMLVYLAYLSLVLHVGLGFLQDERHPVYAISLGVGVVGLGLLHLLAARQERPTDETADQADWIDAGPADSIAEGRGRIALVGGERVAVFRHQDRLSCVSNVCKHQNGPLGEGRIIDGCITCPWHGHQFRPHDGTSPPPFTDSIPTFNLRIEAGRVLVNHRPNPSGTAVEPVPVPGTAAADEVAFYVGYQPKAPAGLARFLGRRVVIGLILMLGLIGTWAWAQSTYAEATFEYGTIRSVVGVVRMDPYPTLFVDETPLPRPVVRYLLAAAGKHGADAAVAGLSGHRVRISGTLAYRDQATLLEIAATEDLGPSAAGPPVAPRDLGVFSLDGEIVDSKCYLGVMNPGEGKTHRGCAARCLSGGTTPLFVTRGAGGQRLEMIMVADAMKPIVGTDRFAGKRLHLTGRVYQRSGVWFLQTELPAVAP